MTYIQLINKVLVRLRESEITSVSQNSYAKLIGELVNETKREVEDAWDWIRLRTTVQVTTVASSARYGLTGAGERAKILYVFNDTDNQTMTRRDGEWMTKAFNTAPQSDSPMYYDLNGDFNGDPAVDVYPIPNAVYELNFNMVIPQPDIILADTIISVPYYPILLGAYAKAIAERGEDQGMTSTDAYMSYQKALSDAIAIDASQTARETDWNPLYIEFNTHNTV